MHIVINCIGNRYIPNEIISFVGANKNNQLYLWRATYNRFKDHYSIFSSKDYVQIVKFLSKVNLEDTEFFNQINDYSENIDFIERKWIEILEKEFRVYLSEEDGYSKIIFFLTILEKIHNKTITQNKFYLSIYKSYNLYWRKYKPKSIKTIPNFYKIIITLKDSSFYEIKLVDNAPPELPSPKTRIWDRHTALNYIDYSFVDKELFDIMYRDSFAKKLHQLIAVYISKFLIIP